MTERPKVTPLPDAPTDYLVKEFEGLRREIGETVREIWQIERYALVATAGIWTWSLTDRMNLVPYVLWLPLGLNIIFSLRALSLYRHARRISDYLLMNETRLFPDASVGWERYFHRNNDPLELATIWVLWLSLLVASIVVPVLLRS
jgi:hypothetical protein